MNRKLPLRTVALACVPTSAIAQSEPGYSGQMMAWGSGMLGGPLIWFLWLVLVAIIVLVAVKLVGGRDTGSGASEDEPIRILKNRYARGEITKDEYEQMRRDLER